MPKGKERQALRNSNAAIFVKFLRDWSADTRIYKLTPPFEGHKYILATAAQVPDGYEMITWACDSKGRMRRHIRLPGCHRRIDKHFSAALARLGYIIKSDVDRYPR